jgi:hypothetical protein
MTVPKLSLKADITTDGESVIQLNPRSLAMALRKKSLVEKLKTRPCKQCGRKTVFKDVCDVCDVCEPKGAA